MRVSRKLARSGLEFSLSFYIPSWLSWSHFASLMGTMAVVAIAAGVVLDDGEWRFGLGLTKISW